ncbi:hypothetical protein [Cupriavidus sp. SK-3]|nr:hypothetical protein [Cupriavidus sp. SK-3]
MQDRIPGQAQFRLPALREAAGQLAGLAPAFLGAARRPQGNPSGVRSLV